MIIYLNLIETDADRSKFELLYSKYRSMMLHVATQILHNQYDAEDAVHQAFLSIIQNLNKVSNLDSPETKSYLIIIVERKAIDILRLQQRKPSAEFDENTYGFEVPPPGDDDLADALAQLPARYREVLLLHFANDYTTREIGKLFGMSQSSVQKLIWRAKQALRKQLEIGADMP